MALPQGNSSFSARKPFTPFVRLRCASVAQAQMLDTEGREFQLPDGRLVSRARVMGIVVYTRIFEPDTSTETQTLEESRPPRKRYGILVLDDGTDIITVKAWAENVQWIERVEVGDSVDVFGRLNLYRGEISLITNLVVKIEDPYIEMFRELQLLRDEVTLGSRPGGPVHSQWTGDFSTLENVMALPNTNLQPSLEDHPEALDDSESPPSSSDTAPTQPEPKSGEDSANQSGKTHVELRGKVLNAIVVLDVEGNGVPRDKIIEFVGSISPQQLEDTLARLIEDGDVYMPRRNIFRKV